MLALTETPLRLAFDPETLHVERQVDDAQGADSQIATAHPLHDLERSTFYSYQLHLGRKSSCRVIATDDRTGANRTLAEFAVDHPPYLHSFGMSAHYIIMAMPPFVVDPLKMALSGKPFIRNYHWRPELGLRFTVIDKRDGSIVVQTLTEAAFFFHHVNAFEKGGDLVVDMIVYPDAEIIGQLDLDRMRSAEPTSVCGELRRYRITLTTGAIERSTLSATRLEFPQLNYEAVAGKPCRFAYGAGSRAGDMSDGIVKINLSTGDALSWSGAGLYPGEPVFVADPDSDGEDAGLLLTIALDVENACSWLVVLDAETLAERARLRTPHPITFGFHGGFFPRSAASRLRGRQPNFDRR